MIPLVIECSDHSFAPYSLLCLHLVDIPEINWNPMSVSDGREVEYDWLCDECLDKYELGDDLAESIVPVCINCVRKLRNE